MPNHHCKEFDAEIKNAQRAGLRVLIRKNKYIVLHPNGKDSYIFHKHMRAVPILKAYIKKCLTEQ